MISADYVIVRGLRCIGGGEASIWIDPGHHDIVIEDVNLSDWAQKWADPSTAPRVQILDPETNPTGATAHSLSTCRWLASQVTDDRLFHARVIDAR